MVKVIFSVTLTSSDYIKVVIITLKFNNVNIMYIKMFFDPIDRNKHYHTCILRAQIQKNGLQLHLSGGKTN